MGKKVALSLPASPPDSPLGGLVFSLFGRKACQMCTCKDLHAKDISDMYNSRIKDLKAQIEFLQLQLRPPVQYTPETKEANFITSGAGEEAPQFLAEYPQEQTIDDQELLSIVPVHYLQRN